jgi:glucosamine kinase
LSENALLLGVDGGGTRCRARLCDHPGRVLGEGIAGPANIRFGIEESFAAVLDATYQCFAAAGLSPDALQRTTACLAVAGASEPVDLAAARQYRHPFHRAVLTTDAHAACVGAHQGGDGGVIIVGTGSVGWGVMGERQVRVGGWGFPVSDEGSGAWLGCEILRRTLWAYDGRIDMRGLLVRVMHEFNGNPHEIVRLMGHARPRDFGRFAPFVVEFASEDDAIAVELMQLAAGHIDVMAARLEELGVTRIALSGGLAASMEGWLAPATRDRLVPAAGDALSGALLLARAEAHSPVPIV